MKHNLGLALLLGIVLSLSVQAELPEDSGKRLVESVCTGCHGLNYLERGQGYDTPEEWQHVMASMVALPSAQATTLSHYPGKALSVKTGKGPDPGTRYF